MLSIVYFWSTMAYIPAARALFLKKSRLRFFPWGGFFLQRGGAACGKVTWKSA